MLVSNLQGKSKRFPCQAHSKADVDPVLEKLFSYRGTIQRVPDIVAMHKVRGISGLFRFFEVGEMLLIGYVSSLMDFRAVR